MNRKYIQSHYKQSRKTSGHIRGKTTDQNRKVDDSPENLQSKTKGSLSTATPFPFSSEVKVKWKKRENIEDYNLEDFIISDYKYHETIKMKMRV